MGPFLIGRSKSEGKTLAEILRKLAHRYQHPEEADDDDSCIVITIKENEKFHLDPAAPETGTDE